MQGRPLFPIEVSILEAMANLAARSQAEVHGFQLSKEISDREGARLLTGYGTLYRALDRLTKAGLLTSRWEDPLIAAEQHRPRRRLYQITATGEQALIDARAQMPDVALRIAQRGTAV